MPRGEGFVRQSTRLILNTGLTYLRMAVTVGMGLLATRLALQALGVTDFGAWGAVLAVVMFIGVIPDGLLQAADRYLGVAIGRGERGPLRALFSTMVAIFCVAAPIAVLVGLPLGRLAVGGIKDLDPARVSSIVLAFDLGLLMLGFSIAMTPFRAMFGAQQALLWPVITELIDGTLKLAAAAFCAQVAQEPIVGLAALTLAAQTTSTGIAVVMCLVIYPESRPKLGLAKRHLVRELTRFSVWSLVGNLSYRIQVGGPPLLISSAFGAAANAPFNAAAQLANYMLNVSNAVVRAVQPAMANAEGRQDRAAIAKLAISASKFCTLLPLTLLVPLVIEADVVTRVWLGSHSPPDVALFVRLVAVGFCIGCIYVGHHLAMMAHGSIGRYMTGALLFQAGGLCVSAGLVFLFHVPSWAVPAMSCLTTFCAVNWYVWHICKTVGLRYADWWSGVWYRVALVAVPAGLAGLGARLLLPEGLGRAIAVGGVYGLVSLPLIIKLGMTSEERGHFARLGSKIPVLGRFIPSGQPAAQA